MGTAAQYSTSAAHVNATSAAGRAATAPDVEEPSAAAQSSSVTMTFEDDLRDARAALR